MFVARKKWRRCACSHHITDRNAIRCRPAPSEIVCVLWEDFVGGREENQPKENPQAFLHYVRELGSRNRITHRSSSSPQIRSINIKRVKSQLSRSLCLEISPRIRRRWRIAHEAEARRCSKRVRAHRRGARVVPARGRKSGEGGLPAGGGLPKDMSQEEWRAYRTSPARRARARARKTTAACGVNVS